MCMDREAKFAGKLYPEKKVELQKVISDLLGNASPSKMNGRVHAIIVPHAAYKLSGDVAAEAYKVWETSVDKNKEWKVIVLAPAHNTKFLGVARTNAEHFVTPLGKVRVKDVHVGNVLPDAHDEDHTIEVQVPWLQSILKKFTITPLLLNEDHVFAVADLLEGCLDENTLLVVSADLCQFKSVSEAKLLDPMTIAAITNLDLEKMRDFGQSCGGLAILVLMSLAKKHGWKPVLLKHANSGERTGNYEQVVGYASFVFVEEN